MLNINFPSFSVDPSFPTDSKAGQLGLKTCVSVRTNLVALLQVSKLSPANGGLNGPKNTVLLASTQAVYKALHSTVRHTHTHMQASDRHTVSHGTDVRAAVAVAVGSLRA